MENKNKILLASFNLFVGTAVGTSVNGVIMKLYGTARVFYNISYVILGVGIFAAIFVSRFEMRKRQGYYKRLDKLLHSYIFISDKCRKETV